MNEETYTCGNILGYKKDGEAIHCTGVASMQGGWCDNCKDKYWGGSGKNKPKRQLKWDLDKDYIRRRMREMGRENDVKRKQEEKEVLDLLS